MSLLGRTIFREVFSSTLLGALLFTFVLFLQRVGKLFELLVRSSAPAATVGQLFLLVLPFALTFAVPLGVLVGVLIALSRMSSDGEVIALRATGVPGRRVAFPVLVLALLGTLVTAGCAMWLTPLSVRETIRILNRLAAAQVTAEIQPRVFEEQFPNTILYVGDVISGPVVRWRNIFLADVSPPEQRAGGPGERGEGPVVTVASEAIAVADPANNRIHLAMVNGSTHAVGKTAAEYYNSSFPHGVQAIQAVKPAEVRARAFSEMDMGPLYRAAYGKGDPSWNPIDPRIEFHQRLVLPPACLILALVGIPLGASSRKGGKSAAFVITVVLAFLYYMTLIGLIGVARQGRMPVELAAWAPNALFALAGVLLASRMERPGERDLVGWARGWAAVFYRRVRGSLPLGSWRFSSGATVFRLPLLPQIVDTYILGSFLFYFLLLLVSFVLMVHVYTFFELMSDMLRNHIPMPRMFTYLLFLTPKLIYDSTPMSVLVAVLVTFGVLTKQNEVTALKACGVSLHRMAAPILISSLLLSAGLFAFDHYYVADANRRQDAIRNEIKGRPVQTYLHPGRKWIFGQGSRIYYYRYFEPGEGVMVGVSVYELEPGTFRLRRHISAERARWEPALETWIFQNGWTRDISGIKVTGFQTYQATTFPELDEPPGYFLKEVKPYIQMNFQELADYIGELSQSGFDTVRLRVQFYKKFSVPLFVFIMAMISIPFAFLTGNRGAMAGVGASFGIAIAYWSVSQFFEQVGNVNQLPSAVAAWSPNVVFGLAGTYLLARMRT